MKVYIKIPFEQETNEGIKQMFDLKEIDLSELMDEFGIWLSQNYQITINCKYWDGNNGYFNSNELVNKFLTEKGYIQL